MVTQQDITDLIVRAKKEEAVTWREQLDEVKRTATRSVPFVIKNVPPVPLMMDVEEQMILEWLTGITPDGGVSYPLKAQRNVQAVLKSYRAKQRTDGWKLVRSPLPHSEDIPVLNDFDPSTVQHAPARLSTDTFSTVQHGENDANTETQSNQALRGNTPERGAETNPDTNPHGSEEGVGETQGCSDPGTIGKDGGVQQLLAMGEPS